MMAVKRRSPTVAVLTLDGLHLLTRFGNAAVLAIPLMFVLLKMLDRLLRDQGAPWWRAIVSGFFGKIDDLSFWVLLSGLLSVLMVCGALGQLMTSRDPAETGWPIRRPDVLAWLAASVVATSAYLVGIYFTNGTFFIELPRPSRLAQVPEGLLNVLMIGVVYFYCVLGLQATRAVRVRLRAATAPPIATTTLVAAEYLLNISFSFILGALVPIIAILSAKWIGALLFEWTGCGIFNWSMFKPDPLSELMDSLAGVAFITAILFLPLLAFFPMIRAALPRRVRMRLNLKCRIETLTISLAGIQPIDAQLSPRVLRLVVFTLVELIDGDVESKNIEACPNSRGAPGGAFSSATSPIVPGPPERERS